MSTTLRRILGIFIILVSAASLVVSIYGLWRVLGLKAYLTPRIDSAFDTASNFLDTTSLALDGIEAALQTANDNITSTITALTTLAESTHHMAPLLDSLSSLTGTAIPETVKSTRTSLISARTTAKTIEDILLVITKIPFIPGEPYSPKVPLYEALDEISTNLGEVLPELAKIEKYLKLSKSDTNTLEQDITQIAKDLKGINAHITTGLEVIGLYRNLIIDLQNQVQSLREQIPGLLTLLTGFLLFVLGWIAVYQVDLLLRGIRLLRSKA
jgi:hypothetical protein